MTADEAARTGTALRREGLLVAGLCVALLAFNLATAARFPIPWLDEVLFTDPAVNLHLGKGFTSSFWWAQPRHEIWAAYPPLYPTLLSQWLRAAPFSPAGVRSFSYVLFSLAVLLASAAVRRWDLLRGRRCRLQLVLLLLLGYGPAFCYRSGRVECLGMLILAAAMFGSSLGSRPWRLATVAAAAVLLPLTGLQFVVYVIVLCLLLWAFTGRRFLGEGAALLAGMAAGCCLLFLHYSRLGLWETFLSSTVGTRTLLARGLDPGGLRATMGSYSTAFNGFLKDPSFLLMLALGLLLAAGRIARGRFRLRSPLGFGLAVALVLPAVMFLTGVYPVYYSWMAFVPLSLGVLMELGTTETRLPRRMLPAVWVVGLPLVFAWVALDWSDRDPWRVEEFVQRHVEERDWVLTDYPAYYPVKQRAAVTLGVAQLPLLTPEERARISRIVAPPDRIGGLVENLGGEWVAAGESLTSRKGLYYGRSIWGLRYDLAVRRRR
jgi:hypothetical protein